MATLEPTMYLASDFALVQYALSRCIAVIRRLTWQPAVVSLPNLPYQPTLLAFPAACSAPVPTRNPPVPRARRAPSRAHAPAPGRILALHFPYNIRTKILTFSLHFHHKWPLVFWL